MAIYTVHLPPDATTAEQVAEKAMFVKEGFAIFGFAFTGLWLLAQRLWLHAIGYALIFGLIVFAFWQFNLPRMAFGGVLSLLGLLIGLEGHEWIRRNYARKGWLHAGTVSGPSLEECERRFFKDWAAAQGRVVSPVVTAAPVAPAQPAPSAVLGVFPTPRGQA
jgi:hypothetical protein